MTTSRNYGPARITTNADVMIQRIEGLKYPDHVFGRVWTDVEYAVFQEYGTSKMAPAAMIRQSIPAIRSYMEQEWKAMTGLPTQRDLEDLVNRVLKFARDEISKNSPVAEGTLRDSWKIEEAQSE